MLLYCNTIYTAGENHTVHFLSAQNMGGQENV